MRSRSAGPTYINGISLPIKVGDATFDLEITEETIGAEAEFGLAVNTRY